MDGGALRAYIGPMDGFDLARFTYLALLLAVIAGYFIAQNRQNLGKMAQQAMIWGLIFVGMVASYGLWTDISRDLAPRQSVLSTGQIEVPRMFDGHFYLTARVNGEPVDFVVDTGATDVVLTKADARRVGIEPEALTFTGTAMTANGPVRTARATVDRISVGEIEDQNIEVWINEGAMDRSLLGMAYLRRFSRIEIADDTLILTR